jgi:[pyruvate, water dikinase]-phosphate phosphotransferase / [pyruvate, water dikinase] kinase
MVRTIFFVSDGTGITAETVGHAVLTQFPGVEFREVRLPFIEGRDQALRLLERIAQVGRESGVRPVVVSSVVTPEVREVLSGAEALVLDVLEPFLAPLEAELDRPRAARVGSAHGLGDPERYDARIDATNYALSHDDGMGRDYGEADVVLVGVSRSGKTPTCLYLALHYGVRAANDPLVPEDLEGGRLPDRLTAHPEKLFGLTIEPARLAEVRETRFPGSRYASPEQCRWEVVTAERVLEAHGIPVVSTTRSSVEEIASLVLDRLGLGQRRKS